MKNSWRWFWIIFVAAYFLTRLVSLTKLPVFADEAIYIRWAQMMVQDPQQYTFLPMFDGKTPLFMWILIPFLKLTPLDPLWAARFMSSLFGLFTVWFLVKIVKELKGTNLAQIGVGILFLITPFTLFHSRMGLIDTLLIFFLSGVFYCFLRLKQQGNFGWAILAGIFWGLALWTKVPALFMAPVSLFIFWLIPPHPKKLRDFIKMGFLFGLMGTIGLLMFYGLRVSPLFPFLFQRSQDFTFKIQEVMGGEWRSSLTNLRRVGVWSGWYLTIPALVAPWLVVPFSLDKKRPYFLPLQLSLLAFVFVAPFIALGKVISPRYFLPMTVFMLPAAALALEYLWREGAKKVFMAAAALILIHSVIFGVPLYTNPGLTPFVPEDTGQYLTEWSAGYGIPEVRDFINAKAQEAKVVVATEGYFGTLPDGLLMYFDRSPLIPQGRLEIFGVGQPIVSLNPKITNQDQDSQVYLLVNEHRMKLSADTCCELVAEYQRPLNGPALQLYRVIKKP